jgi:hypothetical protein
MVGRIPDLLVTKNCEAKSPVVGCTMTSQIAVAIKPIVFGQTGRIFARVSTLASDIDLPIQYLRVNKELAMVRLVNRGKTLAVKYICGTRCL